MVKPFQWKRIAAEGAPRFDLHGTITETADFDGLLAALGPHSVVSAAGVDNINSTGVREWIRFVRRVGEQGKTIEFIECASAFVGQLNMIAGFVGRATVRSVLAPYVCTQCDESTTRVTELDGDIDAQVDAPLACPACGGSTEFDDLPELYFSFVRSRPGAKSA